MKKNVLNALSLIIFLLLSLTSYSQNTTSDSLREIKPINQAKTKPNTSQVTTVNEQGIQTISIGERRPVLTSQEKIQILESHIQSIDTKVEYVNSDEDLKQKAIEDSWFENMQVIREELVLELNELQSE
jgi:hypothetical protein